MVMSVLGVPVDHRLRDIIQDLKRRNEAPTSTRPPSGHAESLRELARSMRSRESSIPENEVDFACYLSEPATQGGIVVVLTQPPKSQTYDGTNEEIVEECKSLLAMREIGSLFGLPFDRLSIFDAFPMVKETRLSAENANHYESHDAFHKMILEKRPAVILTGWKSPYLENHRSQSLRNQAIGATFSPAVIDYNGVRTTMVNMPHPSYYMNHKPTESCFRQLLILEFAQACGRQWGTWREQPWMERLRERCRARASVLSRNYFALNETNILGRLTETLTSLQPLLTDMDYRTSTWLQIEEHLSKNRTVELCADASLILQHIGGMPHATKDNDYADALLQFLCPWLRRRWPALKPPSPPSARAPPKPGLYAPYCFTRSIVVDMPPLAWRLDACLVAFAKKVNLAWTPVGGGGFYLDFRTQSAAFLDLATGIEDALYEIPDKVRVSGKTEDLSLAIEALSL